MSSKEVQALKSYLSNLSMVERKAFASAVGSSVGHICNVSYGYKPCGESLAISIERESDGKVRCEDLRPDVDWNFLRGTEKVSARRAMA